jgi:transcription elongation factor Elf1
MGAPSRVIGDCPNCGNPEALTVFAPPAEGEPETFNGAHQPIIWVTPGLCKATMGANVSCGACGQDFQLRMLIVEELKLPMGFFPVEDV